MGRFSDFGTAISYFPVPKLFSVQILSLIEPLFNFDGWGVGVVLGWFPEFGTAIFGFLVP